MKYHDVTVTDKNGVAVKAQMVVCPNPACGLSGGDDRFHLYVVDGHSHMQCITCGETFCDGMCDR